MTTKTQEQEAQEKTIKGIETAIASIASNVAAQSEKAAAEYAKLGSISESVQTALTKLHEDGAGLAEQLTETRTRLLELEQSGVKQRKRDDAPQSAGALVAGSGAFKALGPNARSMEPVDVKSFHKATIVNATGQNQPLVPSDRTPGIIAPAERLLTVRNLLPVVPTASNLIEYATESSQDIAAIPQYSSPAFENVPKKEASFTFALNSAPVRTIAHWLPASRQVLQDAPMLQGYVDNRLTYGLKLAEEAQLLTGDGTGANLNGLVTQATAYSATVSGDTLLDTILRAINQVALSEYVATGIVIHPTDWTAIRLLKDSQGRYIFGDPGAPTAPTVWGLPVVASASMTVGEFLIGAFAQGATIFDNEVATVRVAEQHADFFIKNMVVVLAEERLALVVYRPLAFVTGTF